MRDMDPGAKAIVIPWLMRIDGEVVATGDGVCDFSSPIDLLLAAILFMGQKRLAQIK